MWIPVCVLSKCKPRPKDPVWKPMEIWYKIHSAEGPWVKALMKLIEIVSNAEGPCGRHMEISTWRLSAEGPWVKALEQWIYDETQCWGTLWEGTWVLKRRRTKCEGVCIYEYMNIRNRILDMRLIALSFAPLLLRKISMLSCWMAWVIQQPVLTRYIVVLWSTLTQGLDYNWYFSHSLGFKLTPFCLLLFVSGSESVRDA